MINKKRADKSVQYWKYEAKQARDRLLNGERLDFTDFIQPRCKQIEATNRARKAKTK